MVKIVAVWRASGDFRKNIEPYHVFFTWDITYHCNYKCSYCSLGSDKDKNNKPRTVYLSAGKWYQIWKSIYNKYGTCEIHFTGGEPFCYPDFMGVISRLINIHTFECSTNLFWDVSKFIKIIPPDKARVGASFHPEIVELKEFLKKTVALKKAGFEVWSNYVAYPPFIENLESAKKKFAREGVDMSILPFSGVYNGKNYPNDYSKEERRYLKKIGADLPWDKKSMEWALNKANSKKNKSKKLCRMGMMYAKIHPDGNVYRCCAEAPYKLGNLLDGTFSLLVEPLVCAHEECPCWKCMVVGEEEKWSSHWVVPPAARE